MCDEDSGPNLMFVPEVDLHKHNLVSWVSKLSSALKIFRTRKRRRLSMFCNVFICANTCFYLKNKLCLFPFLVHVDLWKFQEFTSNTDEKIHYSLNIYEKDFIFYFFIRIKLKEKQELLYWVVNNGGFSGYRDTGRFNSIFLINELIHQLIKCF